MIPLISADNVIDTYYELQAVISILITFYSQSN